MPRFFDYSRWDGRQKVELDADDLLAAMADDVLADGDPWRALQRLMHQGEIKIGEVADTAMNELG